MSAEIEFVQCGQCGTNINESPDIESTQRQPCPACGSKGRKFGRGIHAELKLRGMLALKARHAGGGRPFVEGKIGSDLHRRSGRWMRLERIIDRGRDWYREHISDRETGEVVCHVEEPLSEHRGHGAAKRPEDLSSPDV
jgi:DNA-directed RNA polymerase subunit RPC12/RpoP